MPQQQNMTAMGGSAGGTPSPGPGTPSRQNQPLAPSVVISPSAPVSGAPVRHIPVKYFRCEDSC